MNAKSASPADGKAREILRCVMLRLRGSQMRTIKISILQVALLVPAVLLAQDVKPVQAFDLPAFTFLSPQAQTAVRNFEALVAEWKEACPIDPGGLANGPRVVAWRRCTDDQLIKPLVARHRSRYAVRIEPAMLGGVPTEIITPAEGVSSRNRQRVLIYYFEGDSGYFVAALTGIPPAHRPMPQDISYFKDTDTNDPLVFPIRSDEVLKKFPPALLLTATRDQSLSSVVHMHSRLVALGVEAQLHVWEGLGHAFFFDPDLAQSREMYDVTVKFFDRHLGP
jgi:acetyl esterase/lipase